MSEMFKKLVKLFASLKLAVVIMIALAIIIAVGTIVESKLDATAAKKLVYNTWYMFLIMGMLSVTLIAVMVDRWPWKKRHLPFLLAHVGILLLLLGSWITMQYGVDGNLRVAIGEKSQFLSVPETDLEIWASMNGDNFTKLASQPVDFFLNPPEKNPLRFKTDAGEIKVQGYKPYAIASRKVVASESNRSGSAIRFQLHNSMVNLSEWIVQRRKGDSQAQNLGPAEVVLGDPSYNKGPANQIILTPMDDKSLVYQINYKDPTRKTLVGKIQEGGAVQTGWMGIEFRLLRYMPQAAEAWEFQDMDYPTAVTTSAIELEFQGKKHWLQQDDVLKLFTDKAAYLVVYGQRRIPLGFEVQLKDFQVGRYQGTMRAASYESQVAIPGFTERTTISMNEPLKYKGYTLYQASFQDGPDGKPVASIFSVNHDPGRWLKYLGSLIISLGIISLYYNRRKAARAQAPHSGALS